MVNLAGKLVYWPQNCMIAKLLDLAEKHAYIIGYKMTLDSMQTISSMHVSESDNENISVHEFIHSLSQKAMTQSTHACDFHLSPNAHVVILITTL